MTLSAAIDFSGREAAFAVADIDSSKIIFESYVKMRGRESSGLLNWCNNLLLENGLKFSEIIEWTVGTGPGSFTGMRLVSSLVSGISLEKDIRTRGVPSALALALSVDSIPGDKFAALYDGRRSEVLLLGMENVDGTIIPTDRTEVLSADSHFSEIASSFNYFVAMKSDSEAVKSIMSIDIANSVKFSDHLPVSKLIYYKTDDWNGKIEDLVYIRPAVFVNPKQTRKV